MESSRLHLLQEVRHQASVAWDALQLGSPGCCFLLLVYPAPLHARFSSPPWSSPAHPSCTSPLQTQPRQDLPNRFGNHTDVITSSLSFQPKPLFPCQQRWSQCRCAVVEVHLAVAFVVSKAIVLKHASVCRLHLELQLQSMLCCHPAPSAPLCRPPSVPPLLWWTGPPTHHQPTPQIQLQKNWEWCSSGFWNMSESRYLQGTCFHNW